MPTSHTDQPARCAICGGELRETAVTLLRQRGPQREPVLFEEVPARECNKCGEQWFSMRVMRALEQADTEGRKPTRVLSVPVFPLMELVS